MPPLSFSGLVLVAGVAFLAPLLTELARVRRLPAVVIEIVAGILLGPSVLNWVRVDIPLQVLSLLGLAFLLFLSGLEVEFEQLRGSLLKVIGVSFLASFLLALAFGFGLQAIGLVRSPLLVAIILVATSLGVVVPLLKDSGESTSRFGQLVIGAASLAEFGPIILLSLFFSRAAAGLGTQVFLLAIFAALTAVAALAVFRAERSARLVGAFRRLQDTTAQIRIRGAFLLLAALVALAEALGLEIILGAFAAGVILRFIDQDKLLTHPQFRQKLEGVGFGVFIPVFFITSGVQFDLRALVASPSALARVPLFLLALLVIRGAPALLYRWQVGMRRAVVAGLLQAISLPVIVAAVQIGLALGLLTQTTGAALVAAGLLSVLIFPISASTLIRSGPPAPPVARKSLASS
ncbi:MAG TPA: cation:proton antiporter [Ktedonobacterales bacterium]|nr:cation:proton antiporter [Ktedonobacterales bacterium]